MITVAVITASLVAAMAAVATSLFCTACTATGLWKIAAIAVEDEAIAVMSA